MRKVAGILLVAMLMTVLLPAGALGAGKLTVTQEKFIVMPFVDYHAGYVYAELENTGDKPVEFNGGLFEMFDADGNSIDASNLYYCYPSVVQPGEKAYLYAYAYVEEAKDEEYIDDYALTVTGKGAQDKTVQILPSEGSFGEITEGYWTKYVVSAIVENNTDEVVRNLTAVYALSDADGKLLYVTSCQPYYTGMMPDSKVEIRMELSYDILDYFEKTDVYPADVQVIVYSESYS